MTDPQRAARALFDAMPAATRQEVADRLIAQAPGFRRGHLRSLRPEEVADHKLLRALLPAAVRDATQPTLDQGGSP